MTYGINVLIGANLDGFRTAIREADKEAKQFQGSMQKTGAVAAAAFVGLTAPVGVALKVFSNFETQLQQIAAVSNLTTGELETMKKVALDLGATTKFSASEAAAGMAELSKAGFSARETIAAIPGVMALAAAGGVSVADAATLAGGALRGFGLAASEAGRVADVMAQAANASAVDIGDLQISMKYISSIAATTGQSLEEMAGAVSVLGNNMIKADQAGTTMRAILTRLADPPKDAAEAMAKLGLHITDTTGRMLPFSVILEELRAKTSKMTDTQRTATLSQIAGTEALSGLAAMVKTTGAEYNTMVGQMQHAEGAAQRMADIMNRGLGPAFEQLKGSIETLAIQMGEQYAPAATNAVKVTTGLVEGLTKLPEGAREATAGVTAAAIAATALTAALAGAGLGVSALRLGVTALGLSMGPVGLAILGVSAAVGALVVMSQKQAQASRDTVASISQEQRELAGLTKQYDQLANKTKLTADEKSRLEGIIQKIAVAAPGVASGYDAMGNVASISRDKLSTFNDQLDRQLATLRELELQQRQTAMATRDKARFDVFATEQQIRSIEQQIAKEQAAYDETLINKPKSFYDPTGRQASVGVSGRTLESARVKQLRMDLQNMRDLRDAQAATLRQANQDFDKLAGAAPRAATTPPKVVPGAGFTLGGNGSSTTSDPRVSAIESAYRQKIAEAKVVGEAFREVGLLEEMIGKLTSGGLSKTDAGAKLIEQTRGQIRLLQLEEMEAIKAVAAEAEAAQREKVSNMETANNAILIERDRIDAEEMADIEAALAADAEYYSERERLMHMGNERAKLEGDELAEVLRQQGVQSFREMQGALVALALDPSWERIANLAENLSTDPEKVERWSKAIADGFELVSKGDFEALMGNLKKGDYVALGLFAVAKGIEGIGAAWNAVDERMNGRKAMRDTIAGLWKDVQGIDSRAAAGLLSPEENAQRRVDALRGAVEALIDQRDAEGDAAQRAITQSRIDEIMPQYEAHLATLKAIQEALVDSAAAAERSKNVMGDYLETVRKVSAAAAKAAEEAERLKDLEADRDAGGRDEEGRKISVAAERDLQLSKQQAANAKKIADLRERELKIRQELAKIDVDEAERIKAIEDEGIAQRSLSETQDKAQRISKVQAEAAEKRKAKNEELAALAETMTLEQEQGRQALERIRNQSTERLAALDKAIIKQSALADQAERELRAAQAAAAMRQAESAMAMMVFALGSLPKHHSGGIVSGRGEQPRMLLGKEMVLTEDHQARLWEWINHKPTVPATNPGAGGGLTIGSVEFNIQAAPGDDGAALGTQAWGAFNQRLRKAGSRFWT